MRRPTLLPVFLMMVFAALTTPPLVASSSTYPTLERGFSPEKSYLIGDIDHVNTLNGNLLLTIPIGGTYTVGGNGKGSGALSYSLSLVSNSKLWDYDFRKDPLDPLPWPAGKWFVAAHPGQPFNAGFGWTLSFGRMMSTGCAPDTSYCYVGPDGGIISFYQKLHEEGPTDSAWYSRDGTYLRLRAVGTDLEVDFPNGETHRFQSGSGRLTEMRDRFGNWMRVSYPNSTTWSITDSVGRSHTVTLAAAGYYGTRVSSVSLAAFDGTQATYTFGYTNAAVQRPCVANDPETPTSFTLSFLTSVGLPDGSSFSMPTSDYILSTPCDPNDISASMENGAIRGLRLPTLGRLEWSYGRYVFPPDSGGPPPCSGCKALLWNSRGVATRTLRDAAGATVGVWRYLNALDMINGEAVRTVVTPLGDKTVHYFAVRGSGSADRWEYGLPYSTVEGDGAGRFRSTKTYQCDPNPSNPDNPLNCVLKRSTWLRYEKDTDTGAETPWQDPALSWRTNRNRRVASSRTIYHDDGNRWAAVDHSQFAGLGNYRRTTTSGNFGAGDVRATHTHYNPGQQVYPPATGGYSIPSPSLNWVLDIFDHSYVIEAGVTSHRTDYCFNTTTGFLNRKRTRRVAGSTGAGDVIVVYTGDAQGNVIRERHYGGDQQSLSSGGLCGLSLPSTDQYRIDHTYQFGALRTSRFFFANGTAMSHFSVDRDIDFNTGFVRVSRDVSGLATTYEYDALGRLTWEMPASGHDGWTQYVYTRATSATDPANVVVRRRGNGSKSATVLAREWYFFDAFGRLSEERRHAANSTWPTRFTQYNAMGWRSSVSEFGSSSARTQFLEYDPFGRPGRIRPPDGSAHDVTFAYFGDREVRRTVRVGESRNASTGEIIEVASTTTERYDRQGRLWQVVEPSGPSNGNVTTTYSYDAGGNLRQASTTGSGTTQNRIFTYDQRGFLIEECHPEKGATGNGCVELADFDPFGNVGRRMDGPLDNRNDLIFTYDRAGRLTQVRESQGNGNRILKAFVYGSANSGSDRRLGKLQRADRYNYVSINTTLYDILVRETYVYAGRGGRPSSRSSDLWVNSNPSVSPPSEGFHHTVVYNELGALQTVGYPTCAAGGCTGLLPTRNVTTTYTNGWITGVTGYASGITYHPNLMVNQVPHANGVTVIHGQDPNFMQRPASIATSGALNAAGTAASNWATGAYAYDGAGNVVKTGNSWYLYDRVSRVKSTAQRLDIGGGGTEVTQGFTYDAFGNLTAISGTVGRSIPVIASTNRLSGSVAYSPQGNLTSWNGNSYRYDRFDMMMRFCGGTFNDSTGACSSPEHYLYIYTADDQRIWSYKIAANSSTWTLRGLDTKVLREVVNNNGAWQAPKDNIYRGSQLLAAETSQGVRHYHLDHLGTPRLVTDGSRRRVAYHVYYPFGEEATAFNQTTDRMRFTGHERDLNNLSSAADDLDYMHARFYNPQLGRFLATDRAPAVPSAPQTWNRYAYTLNNPLKYTDPDGEFVFLPFAVAVGVAVVVGAFSRPDAANAPAPGDKMIPSEGLAGTLGGAGVGAAVAVAIDEVARALGYGEGMGDMVPSEPYDRRKHYGSTPSRSDREHFGAGADEVVNHEPPLVKRYYEGDPGGGERPGFQMTPEERSASGRDRSRMNTQSRTESCAQGADCARYSREKRREAEERRRREPPPI